MFYNNEVGNFFRKIGSFSQNHNILKILFINYINININYIEKIFITGTGRCGTTFLIKIFSFLNIDTGYNKSNYNDYIYKNCNSGMERLYDEPFNIIKNPLIIYDIYNILQNSNIKIKTIIIPIRDYKLSAKSRVFHNDLLADYGMQIMKNLKLIFIIK